MRRALLCLVICPVFAAACATSSVKRFSESPRTVRVPGTGVYSWDEEHGWTQPDRGVWGAPDQVRAESFRAFEGGNYADALAGFLALQDMGPMAVGADSSTGVTDSSTGGSDLNFYTAECYFQLGNYEQALEHYQVVYRKDFPAQTLLDQALHRVFTIGMAYLRSEVPCDFLGIIRYSCPNYGIEILASPNDGLITEYPVVSFADEALIEIAKHYYETKEYPEAVPLYDRVASDHESEWADLAEYQAAKATFQQVRGVDYDQRTIQEADRRFKQYTENHRRGDHTDKAREMVRKISEMEGAKNLRIAKFYLRESQPEACELYLRRVLVQHPNSTAAREAREIQKQLDRTKRGS